MKLYTLTGFDFRGELVVAYFVNSEHELALAVARNWDRKGMQPQLVCYEKGVGATMPYNFARLSQAA